MLTCDLPVMTGRRHYRETMQYATKGKTVCSFVQSLLRCTDFDKHHIKSRQRKHPWPTILLRGSLCFSRIRVVSSAAPQQLHPYNSCSNIFSCISVTLVATLYYLSLLLQSCIIYPFNSCCNPELYIPLTLVTILYYISL